MYSPTFLEFKALARKGNVIPVFKEINADLDTPVSAFLKMERGDYSFLLESVEGQEKIARYSFLGSNPSMVIASKGRHMEIINPQAGKRQKRLMSTSILDEVRAIMGEFKTVGVPGLPRFYGGLVGFIGYDVVRFFERIPDRNYDDLNMFDAVLILTDTMLIFDHVNHTIKIVALVILPKEGGDFRKLYAQALKKIEAIHVELDKRPASKRRTIQKRKNSLAAVSNITKANFLSMVKKAKTYIKKGDIIQVVLSQRFKVPLSQDPFDVYRNLRSLNPSPYMFFLRLGDCSIAGASPEMLVRCEDGLVQTRPIAGTRPRGRTVEQDSLLEQELRKDIKEKAEHLMLVDLGRNDVGRVCLAKTVNVTEFMNVERYSHVMHLVSEVSGVLDKKNDAYDALRACFPAGTVSGSPKIRAMEIIDELENVRRGVYAGCIGYFSFSHNMDTCIAIRTIVMKDSYAYVQAGAGIVADSKPEREYTETVNKAKALLEAITQKGG
ncbi:MAG: anthranilate synthase component I [Candidatus Omnitrophica bacterium]|nr:anthranilate synthase component I [Candidatus Omnitrophota bacterium]